MLTQAGAGRGGRELPGPVWADRGELCADPLPGLDQIVGHTPVPTVEVRPIDAGDGAQAPVRLAFCDTFSLTSRLSPIGDGSMLVVDGAGMRAVGDEELGLPPWKPAVWDWMTTRFHAL